MSSKRRAWVITLGGLYLAALTFVLNVWIHHRSVTRAVITALVLGGAWTLLVWVFRDKWAPTPTKDE